MLAGKKTDERHMGLDFCAILQADKKSTVLPGHYKKARRLIRLQAIQ